MNLRRLLAAVFFCTLSSVAFAQDDPTAREWNRRVEPFRVVGNVFYVGAADITSFLITTSQGLILIDGGLVETAPIIRKNIEQLGFKLSDVRFLLNSHAHFDHAGGLAALKQLTGAKLVASAGDKQLLEAGGHNDPQFGNRLLFPGVRVDQVIGDGEVVTLGGVVLHAVLTPGHTPGCTTWTMQAAEDGKKYNVLFLCSTSVPASYRLVDNKNYPQIASDYESTFARLNALSCDVFLASHGSMFDLEGKIRALKAGSSRNPFIDHDECHRFLNASQRAFKEKLEEQERAASAAK